MSDSTDETCSDLDAIETRGRDPLNALEDARDGLEQLGADVVALVAEVRNLRRLVAKAGRYIESAAHLIADDSDPDEEDTADALAFAEELTTAAKEPAR